MESYEATQVVLSKLHSIDPENASKIMGYLLLNCGGDDIIRFARGPESIIVSIINIVKTELGILSNSLPAPLVSHPISTSGPNPLAIPPRLAGNGFYPTSPSSPSIWASTHHSVSPNSGNHSVLHDQTQRLVNNPYFHHKSSSFDNDGSSLGCGLDQYPDEVLRSKMVNQRRLATQRSALMLSEEFHKLNRARIARNEFLGVDSDPASRQIYLTFPAESTFIEDDVSDYFSLFGPVQDVRIPYQAKRMFGFVTFVYPETVNMVLAKRNPHFICDSRVLVKPYKDKGKLSDKKQQEQLERGDFSSSSASGLDYREPFELPIGGRMFCSTEEMLLKRKIEEQALQLECRRLMNLQILDMKNHQYKQNMPIGSPILSPNLSRAFSILNSPPLSNGISHDASEEDIGTPAEGVNGGQCDSNGNVQNNEENSENDECELPMSSEYILPDGLFSSPTKPAFCKSSVVSSSTAANFNSSAPSSSSTHNRSSHKSCFFELPRLSSGIGDLDM